MNHASYFRIYWLGPATDPGVWAIDMGKGTKIWRVHSWELSGLVRSDQLATNAPADSPRPRGWVTIYPETFARIEAPQGMFQNTALNGSFSKKFIEAYEDYAVAAF